MKPDRTRNVERVSASGRGTANVGASGRGTASADAGAGTNAEHDAAKCANAEQHDRADFEQHDRGSAEQRSHADIEQHGRGSAERDAVERLVVKWNSPAEELVGIARLAQALIDRRISTERGIRLVVPSANWGVQLERACASVGLKATFEMPGLHTRTTPDAHAQADVLTATSTQAQADALTAAGTQAVVSLTDHGPVPIVHYRHLREAADYVYVVGCVDGLVPGNASDDPSALASCRSAFETVARSARVRLVISLFTRIELDTANRARIAYARTKVQDGMRVAMTHPTPFLAAWGTSRPTTVGGQALLRRYGLN